MRFYPCIVLLFTLVACEPRPAAHQADHGSGRIDMLVPAPLVENDIDLNNPEAVATALGITLNGDRSQKLYDISMTVPDAEHQLVTRLIEIRVENISQGSAMIASMSASPEHALAEHDDREEQKLARR